MRTFIAIELPGAVRQRVVARQQAFARLLEGQGLASAFRWTAADNLHLTLRFLGDTSGGQRAQIEGALKAIAATAPCFQLAVGQAGAFPNLRKPNILWLDFTGDLAQLTPLQGQIEAAARAAGFAAETRAFAPHLTIARAQKNAAPVLLQRAGEVLRAALAGAQPGPSAEAQPGPSAKMQPELSVEPFTVEAVHLIHSDLQPQGPIYTPIASFPLR
jgi:2'-5' RNA ligase